VCGLRRVSMLVALTCSRVCVSCSPNSCMQCRYDHGHKGFLDHGNFKQVLQALGMLNSVRDKDQYVSAQMLLAGNNRSDALSFHEFSNYYSSLQFAGVFSNASDGDWKDASQDLMH
jgi:hypothetical protein